MRDFCNRAVAPGHPNAFLRHTLCQAASYMAGYGRQISGAGSMEQRRSSQGFKRKELVAKLNSLCQRAFKAAADAAKLRGNPYVELIHFIEQLVLSERSDVQMIVADAGLDASRL